MKNSKKKLIDASEDTWKLLKIYAVYKDIPIQTALDKILEAYLGPLDKALKSLDI